MVAIIREADCGRLTGAVSAEALNPSPTPARALPIEVHEEHGGK
jgi:hypothetical protein